MQGSTHLLQLMQTFSSHMTDVSEIIYQSQSAFLLDDPDQDQ